MHGRLDLPDLAPLYEEFCELPLVSISDAQRSPLPRQNWVGTVLPWVCRERDFCFHPEPELYLAFLGRISREKRVDRAIAIAKACGWPLKIAAKVDPTDVQYFKHEIAPLMDHPLIDYIGEITDAEKSAFLGNARALLFPIDWPEPFGLVMIESLACGTPVVAFRGGSVAEVIEDGVTGFVVDDLDQAIARDRRVHTLDRRACRDAVHASLHRIAHGGDYVRLYRQLHFHVPSVPVIVCLRAPALPIERVPDEQFQIIADSERPIAPLTCAQARRLLRRVRPRGDIVPKECE